MAFQLNITTTNQTEGKARPEVKWDDLNAHVVEAAGTADEARSIPGIISGIIDLGEQVLEDAEKVFTGTAADEEAEKEKYPATYFKDGIDRETGKKARLKCYPQKPVQQVAITVDFPQVQVDKGQFFGKSNPLPLRMSLNGEFSISVGDGKRVKIVGRPYNIRETKHDLGDNKTTWAFAKNNGLHKLAAAAKLLDSHGLFTKNRIGELLGKVVQFEFRVWMKPDKKDKTRSFFTEDIKLVGKVPEGVAIPAVPDGLLYGVNLYGDNDAEAVKQLRASFKDTIKRANNYAGSDLERLFNANAPAGSQKDPVKDAVKEAEEAGQRPDVEPVAFDDDIPF